ncbi:hypothetical protein ACT7C7_29970 [Bacillus cereus]
MHLSSNILLEIDKKMKEIELILKQCTTPIDLKNIKCIQQNLNDVRELLNILSIDNKTDETINDLINKLHIIDESFNMFCDKS